MPLKLPTGIDIGHKPAVFDQQEQEALTLLQKIFRGEAYGDAALVSSFGAESAVLLHLLSRTAPEAPVLIIDTLMLFEETLRYQLELTEALGLTGVQRILPDLYDARDKDPFGRLHLTDSAACCHLRKVQPLEQALAPYDAWVTGRKRYQTESRADLQLQEMDSEGRTKLNPLAHWSEDSVREYFVRHELPNHPLVARGFASIGCAPCTTPVAAGEDARSGRWRNEDRDECGIHFENGKLVRNQSTNATTLIDGLSK